MKRLMLIGCVALALAGCMSKEMKSTPFYEGGEVKYLGDVSERVNLWPIAYYRNPVGSVAWPILSFSNDLFALRPIYSQYKQNGVDGAWDEYNLFWPIGQADLKHKDYRFFPFFWGKDYQNRSYQAIFPIYWNGPKYNSLFPLWIYHGDTSHWWFGTIGGLAGAYRRMSGYRASWMFPLWFEDNEGLFATPIYGRTPESWWVFPLWYKGEKAFVSLLYAHGSDEKSSWWAAPATLSWGNRSIYSDRTYVDNFFLLWFGGWHEMRYPDYTRGSWYAFPLMSYDWISPGKDSDRKSSGEAHALCYLTGWKTKDDQLQWAYAFPLFGYDENGSWYTPLVGQHKGHSETNTYFATPLVGVTTGEASGSWAFPLWYHSQGHDFDAKVRLIDSAQLPDSVGIAEVKCSDTNSCYFGKTRLSGKNFYAGSHTTILLHDADHTISGDGYNYYGAATNKYTITERYKRGHRLLLNYKSKREVEFDLKTKAKLSDEEESEASFLCWLYEYEREYDRMKDDEYARHRVLWKLWDWEEVNGEVTLDVFPGFTYDSKKNGYSKTSFLWRFFRHEYHPEKGRAIDLLFIPIWR